MGRFGREGFVVHFTRADGTCRTAAVQPGVVAVSTVVVHSDGRRIIVLPRDDLWVADPEHQTAALLVSAVNEI